MPPWAFALLPRSASDKLPTRAMVSVEGTLAGHPFQTTLLPDGQGGHWLRIEAPLLHAGGIAIGNTLAFEVAPMATEPEPDVPADLQQALTDHSAARTTWDDITPVARRDWIFWMRQGWRRKRYAMSACLS